MKRRTDAGFLWRSENGVLIQGWTPDRIEDLVLENVHVEVDKGKAGPVGVGVFDHPSAGFFIKNASAVTPRNCRVRWGEPRQDYWRHAIDAHSVADLRVENFEGESAFPGKYDAVVRD